ncbi:hypothetical protein BCR43DRAFT_497811, partial [Syncephalastrum racemosum]
HNLPIYCISVIYTTIMVSIFPSHYSLSSRCSHFIAISRSMILLLFLPTL